VLFQKKGEQKLLVLNEGRQLAGQLPLAFLPFRANGHGRKEKPRSQVVTGRVTKCWKVDGFERHDQARSKWTLPPRKSSAVVDQERARLLDVYLNAKVRKKFDDGIWYPGRVTKCWKLDRTQLWKIQYEDGDMEDVELEELLTILDDASEAQASSAASGRASNFLTALRELEAQGWKRRIIQVRYVGVGEEKKVAKREYQYISPDGKKFASLAAAISGKASNFLTRLRELEAQGWKRRDIRVRLVGEEKKVGKREYQYISPDGKTFTSLAAAHSFNNLTWGCGDEVQAQEQGEGMMGGEIVKAVKVVKVAMSQDIEDMSDGQEQQLPPPPTEEDVNTHFDLVPHGSHRCWECVKGNCKSRKCSAKQCRSRASSGVIPKVGIIAIYTSVWYLD
jgi:hypothetical protein